MKKFLTVITAFLPILLAAQTPDWYTTHQHPKYPSSQFIVGVGAGPLGATGAESAKKAALADIVAQLRVQVQAETKSVTQNFAVNDDEQVYSDFKRQSRTLVSDELTGAEVALTEDDEQGGNIFALMVLNREKYAGSLRAELESGWKQASDLRTAAKDYASKGKLIEAVQSINQIKQVIAPLLAKQVLHNAAARTPFAFPSLFNPAALQNDLRGILATVKIEKTGGDNQKGKVGESFAKPFTVLVTADGVPCSGATIAFRGADKTPLGEAVTDAAGVASFTTLVRNGNGMTAALMIAGLGREFDANLASSAASFQWTAQASDKAFAVNVNAKSRKVSAEVNNKLSSAISQIGYPVVTMAKYTLNTTVSTGVPSTIDGMAGTLYTVTVEVKVDLKDNAAGAVTGSATFSAKGVGASEEEAALKGASALKIDLKVLGDLLQK